MRSKIGSVLRNPLKIFIALILINFLGKVISNFFGVLGLPEIANPEDNLSIFQVYTGFFLALIQILISLLNIILVILFNISIFYFIYHIIKPVKK